MSNEFEIGRVVAVETAQVTIELNQDLKALTRTTYEGAQEVSRINSYVILPVGARRLVAMVTKVLLTQEAEIRADRTMVTLPSARRIMKATLVGTIDNRCFSQGVSLFPVLDNPVLLASTDDLNLIFDRKPENQPGTKDPNKPGYCIRLGNSAVFEGYPIQIDPDIFFGKHAAILGSTGSGKSCTIATLLQSLLECGEIKRTNFVILDTNGEYRSAFQNQKTDGTWTDTGEKHSLYIPSDPNDVRNRLVIPYWFLNAEDFVRLFRAKEGLQAPVLLRALRLARSGESGEAGVASTVEVLRTACNKILAHTMNDTPSQQWALALNIESSCADGLRYRKSFPQQVESLDKAVGPSIFQEWEKALTEVIAIIKPVLPKGSGEGLGGTRIQEIRRALDPVVESLNKILADDSSVPTSVSADQPLFFERSDFLEKALETAMHEETEGSSPGRVRDACGPMFLRIRRFFEDPRFSFLFHHYPNVTHILATFIRDVIGLPSAISPDIRLSSISEGQLPFYDRQRSASPHHSVVIVDLSLLAAEVLENVTALIGRLILEFLQRLGEFGGEKVRGSLPVVLFLEEAQNYIQEPRHGEEESISRVIFERIAREGRKHGLGLVVSSQRPSELSKTVLSQCSSFIVHRLQNPEDLRYFKEIVPSVYGDLLSQLPALAPQTALVLGECVRAPALVRIREARPLPRSRDPRFYNYWVADSSPAFPVEDVCAKWEGSVKGDIETTVVTVESSNTLAGPTEKDEVKSG